MLFFFWYGVFGVLFSLALIIVGCFFFFLAVFDMQLIQLVSLDAGAPCCFAGVLEVT